MTSQNCYWHHIGGIWRFFISSLWLLILEYETTEIYKKNLKQALFSNLLQVRVTNFLVDRRKAESLDFYKQYKKLISYIF